MRIKVVKLEPYPKEFPTSKAVGFQLTFNNDRSAYIDTTVDLSLDDEAAVNMAYENLSVQIENLRQSIGALPRLLGTEWIIETDEEEEEEQYSEE